MYIEVYIDRDRLAAIRRLKIFQMEKRRRAIERALFTVCSQVQRFWSKSAKVPLTDFFLEPQRFEGSCQRCQRFFPNLF